MAMAGELATEYGITGWEHGEALEAAMEGFRLWRDQRGEGQTETRRILDGVRQFIHTYGDSRFTALNDDAPPKGATRAGWFRDDDNGRVYLLTKSALEEAAKGFDIRRIGAALAGAGWIVKHDDGRRTKKTYVPTRNDSLNLYAIRPDES